MIFNLNKMTFNVNGMYEIIPYKISISLLLNNKIIFTKNFYANYNLYDSVTEKYKINSTGKFLIKNKYNLFPTKEVKGKVVIRNINKINYDQLTIRNYIRSLLFFIPKLYNKYFVLITADNNNLLWLLNKRVNKLISLYREIDVSTQVISDIDLNIDCEKQNEICGKDLTNNDCDNEINIINSYTDFIF